jgi:tRNA pseudouridine55 synthase
MSSDPSAANALSPERSLSGILLVDKPQGWTSFDVVNYVRKAAATYVGKKPKHMKVGHTGTLDPMATGLLVLLVGTYTKRAPELSKVDKTYEVRMTLGLTSTTGDEEGEKSAVSDLQPDLAAIEQVMGQFTGEQLQTPPIYSAIKVDGQRAYKLARQGKAVRIEARPITVYELQLTKYQYPEVTFSARVSSGTYIRALVEDMGTSLTTGAYLSGLRRTEVGSYKLQDAITVDAINTDSIEAYLKLA